MSFTTYTSKNLIKTAQDTSFYDYLTTGGIVESNNQKIKSAKMSADIHQSIASLGRFLGFNKETIASEEAKAKAANDDVRALQKRNYELVNTQFSDDFVESPRLQLEIPNYSVENYIEERAKWTKGITSVADEPGWFYFKIFFIMSIIFENFTKK